MSHPTLPWWDIPPGEDAYCDWSGCANSARWTRPSPSEHMADTQWCDEHYDRVMRVGDVTHW